MPLIVLERKCVLRERKIFHKNYGPWIPTSDDYFARIEKCSGFEFLL